MKAPEIEPVQLSEEIAWAALETVVDPEIPVISLVDLGIVLSVVVSGNTVEVDLTPTFAGCPAIHVMKRNMEIALQEKGFKEVKVNVLFHIPWSSNKITEKGRKQLLDFGLSPPPAFDGMLTLDVLKNAVCPKCGSNNTKMISPFGPTACRAIHHCNNCLETFQQFKPL